MDKSNDYFTLNGYSRIAPRGLTPAMEDYLEMIYRLLRSTEVVRIGQLAESLNVRPSSATKMIRQLTEAGLTDSHRYGYIVLTPAGRAAGEYLIYRHRVIYDFLRTLNGTDDVLAQAEKIEHFLDRDTVANLEQLTRRLQSGI